MGHRLPLLPYRHQRHHERGAHVRLRWKESLRSRNYRYFVSFVVSTFLLAAYVFGVVLVLTVRLAQRYPGALDSFFVGFARSKPGVFGTLVFAECILCPLGNLTAFHCSLIATNVTASAGPP